MRGENFIWEMAQRIFAATISSDFGKYIWLLSPSSLGKNQPAHRLENGLILAYSPDPDLPEGGRVKPGSPLNEEWSRYFLNFLKKELLLQQEPIMVEADKEVSEGQVRFRIRTERGGVYVPLDLVITQVSGERMKPESLVMDLDFMPGQRLGYFRYPAEARAAQLVCHIMRDLELISQMEPYLYLYELLQECAMDGRDFGDRFADALETAGIKPDERRRKMFESYADATYMKKRWKVLLRRQRIKQPTWEDTHRVLSAFILPVWKMMEDDMVFIGDWMPTLERFLE